LSAVPGWWSAGCGFENGERLVGGVEELATGIATFGDQLYAVDSNRGLRIFDRTKLSARTMPELGSWKTTAAPSAVATRRFYRAVQR
jgi:hypothetical protein